jgi:hypothetical protein
VWHQVNTVGVVKIIPGASTPPHSPNAPQGLNSELLIKVPVVELRKHNLVPPSHLIHSRPREAEAGGLRTQGLEIAGKTNPSKIKMSRKGSGVFGPPIADSKRGKHEPGHLASGF